MIRAFLAATLLAVAAPGAAPTPTSPPPSVSSSVQAGEATVTGRTVIDDGHVDMGARFVDGAWSIQIRDDTVRPSVWRPLPDVVLQITDAARTTVPADERFAFLGQAGTPVWVLPQAQQAGVLWPGWNTQDPEVATTINREVAWTLHGVTGPGQFVLFLNGNFGQPQVVFDGAKSMPQRTGIEVNSHVHGNWVFTAPGSYLLDVEMSGTTTAGQPVTDRDTLRIFVGAGDATAAFGPAPAASGAESSPAATSGPAPDAAADSESESDSDSDSDSADGSTPIWPWPAAGGAVLLALAAGGYLTARRRRGPPAHPDTEA